MVKPPSGTVTFLFTDVEGSTRLWEEHPAEMQVALERHEEIVRSAVGVRDGYVFSMAGDAFAVAFGGPGDAVSAALEVQMTLAAQGWAEAISIRVRMGVHTGEAQERDSNYFGPTLNRAARVMSAAIGGQVLLSAATAELVRHEVELADLGEHRLRDLSSIEHLWELRAEGLPPTSGRVLSLEGALTNLPSMATSFVGREDESKKLAASLASERLVTLLGVGGVGKTRLAVQVAAEMLPVYSDGVWLVELAAVGFDGELENVVADALGVPPAQQLPPAERLRQHLRGRVLLLVLDNCEHLLDSVADLVSDVLLWCPGVTILTTSRESLAVEGEASVAVPSLPGETTAVELFCDRLASVRPDLEFDDQAMASITELCVHLDGLPLAIELAAARSRAMSPAELLDRLDRRFQLLAGGTRRMKRQQTMRATIDWSYDLLSEPERLVLQWASVFAGGFDLKAAEAVLGAAVSDPDDVIEHLMALVDKSLLQVSDQRGATRYSMLETIREYALEHLATDEGQLRGARLAHGRHFARLVAEIVEQMCGPDQLVANERLEAEIDNLSTAVSWSVGAKDVDLIADLVAPLSRCCHAIGARTARLGTLAAGLPTLQGHARAAQVYAVAAWDGWLRAEPADMNLWSRRTIEEPDPPADALRAAAIATAMTDSETGRELAERSVAIARAAGDDYQLGQCLTFLASIMWLLHEDALSVVEECLDVATKQNNPHLTSSAQTNYSWMLIDHDDPRALAFLEQAAAHDPRANASAVGLAHAYAGALLAGSTDLDSGLRRILTGFEILQQHGFATERAVTILVGLDTLGRSGHTTGIAQMLTTFDAVHPHFTQAPRFASLHANATQHIDHHRAATDTPATMNELDDLFETFINHALAQTNE